MKRFLWPKTVGRGRRPITRAERQSESESNRLLPGRLWLSHQRSLLAFTMEQDDWIRRTLNDLIHQLEDTSTSLAAGMSYAHMIPSV